MAAQAGDWLPAANAFPLLPEGAADDTPPQYIPLATNHALDEAHDAITRGIIVIHDATRDANTALMTLTTLAGSDNQRTMILAPQFLLDSDITRFNGYWPDQGKSYARWAMGAWESGGDSLANVGQQRGISSFTALDMLLMYLADTKRFPSLNTVVIVGHGTGADFVQRYAALGRAPKIVERDGLTVRYIVANAGSYLYFTPTRPRKDGKGLGSVDAAACPAFDTYDLGLEKLNLYARQTGENAAKLDYPTHSILYLTGAMTAAPNDPAPDTRCGALLQGADRVARAAHYQFYLNVLYSEAAQKTQHFETIYKVGYDAASLYASRCGMSYLFGEGDCAAQGSP